MRKFVDMAKSPEEVKEQTAIASPIAPKVPVYPYGLCLCFGEDELKKLDLDDDCEVGDLIHFVAFAKVTSKSENEVETADGEKSRNRRVEIQITQIAVENESDEDPSEDRRDRFYGEDEEGE